MLIALFSRLNGPAGLVRWRPTPSAPNTTGLRPVHKRLISLSNQRRTAPIWRHSVRHSPSDAALSLASIGLRRITGRRRVGLCRTGR